MDDVTALRCGFYLACDGRPGDPQHRREYAGGVGTMHAHEFDPSPFPPAAVEARAALTPERLAKALHDRGLGCWEPRGPNGDLCWEVTHGNPLNDLHTPAAERILAALATDEAVP